MATMTRPPPGSGSVVVIPSNPIAVAGFVCGLVGAALGVMSAFPLGGVLLGVLGLGGSAAGSLRARRGHAAHGLLALIGLALGFGALTLGVVGLGGDDATRPADDGTPPITQPYLGTGD